MAVLPYGRSGIIGGAMLGLGRALGETLAVAIVLSVSPGTVTFNLISTHNPSTIAANIALQFPESTGIGVNTLIASGLALFVMTLAVNVLARAIVNRRAEFSGAQLMSQRPRPRTGAGRPVPPGRRRVRPPAAALGTARRVRRRAPSSPSLLGPADRTSTRSRRRAATRRCSARWRCGRWPARSRAAARRTTGS